jgi:glutamyl-Q tRNA(Asp) synthetase
VASFREVLTSIMAQPKQHYVGRFAPSPTGPLHFGSLIAAVGSYLQARSQGGRWLVRIEDLDPLREQPNAAGGILRTLKIYGFDWDDEVIYQSRRTALYRQALTHLTRTRYAYYCICTRKSVALHGRAGAFGPIYPGTCRARGLSIGGSLRLRTHDREVGFNDALLGDYFQRLETAVGDFVIRRADGQFAYHLAVVVDDAAQGITQVVRGVDLLDSTPRQIYLQQLLSLHTPSYAHLPVALNARGFKLSKQTRAEALPMTNPKPHLIAALRFLNHEPPAAVQAAELDAIWRWAMEHWSLRRAPRLCGVESRAVNGSLRETRRFSISKCGYYADLLPRDPAR